MASISTPSSSFASLSDDGGYDYTFVNTLPDRVICVICHFPSRNPYLSECCGNVFCKSCLDKTKVDSHTTCPMCADATFHTFCNKQIDREVQQLHVYCTNKKKGCKWIGELKDITCHCEKDDGCKFEVVKCSNDCGKMLQRRNLTTHAEKTCPLRTVTCQYCGETGFFQFIKGGHENECQKFPIQCPNHCDTGTVLRENLKTHRKECPLEMVKCEYYKLGCEVKVPRKRRNEHEEENAKEHLQMAKRKLIHGEQRIANLEFILHRLINSSKMSNGQLTLVAEWSNQLGMLASLGASSIQVCPVTIKMTNYSLHVASGSCWYSSSFYTHHKGYTMQLRVYASGCGKGKGTHLSIFLRLMKGAYDDELSWPLTGNFIITLLNQLNDDDHYSYHLNFDDETPFLSKSRVDSGSAACGWGTTQFISNTRLKAHHSKCQFLKDECIYIQVCM